MATATTTSFDDHLANQLLAQRIIFLGTEVNDESAQRACSQLLLLAAEDPHADISLYINSPGGSYPALMAIYDTMGFIGSPVATYCVGQAASTAAVLLAAGDPGTRYVLEHSRVVLGQPVSEVHQGMVSDLRLQAKEMMRIREQVEEILARHTPHEAAALRADMDREKVFTAREAIAYGLPDEVIGKRIPLPTAG
jgi:ATP-dependent Clp protease, protease subunit